MELNNNINLLKYAKHGDNPELLIEIIEAGADKNAVNETGATSLHIATQHANNNIIAALIKLKVNLNDKDQNGNTALHYAVMIKNKIAAKALVEVGANPNIKNNDNKTALKIAQENHIEMVKILLPTATKKKAFYTKERTPLNW